MVDTRPAVPLTNAQLLMAATRSQIGWAIILIGALTPVMLLSVNPIIIYFSNSHSPLESHGKGWMLLVGWIVFGVVALSYGFLLDFADRIKSSRRISIYLSTALLLALTLAIPKGSVTSTAVLLTLLQVPSAILATTASHHLARAKQKTGRGSASALFALGLTLAYFIAAQLTDSAASPSSGIIATNLTAVILIGIGLLINLWLKRNPGPAMRHRISRHDKKKLKVNYFVRFYLTNVVFFTGVFGIQYNLVPLANSNASKKGVALDQIVAGSITLYTVGSIGAILATVFFLFATERVERTYLVGTIIFGVTTLMLISIAKASVFVLIRSLSGVAVGITTTTLLLLTITYLPRKAWRGRAVGLLFSSLALSHISGPILSHFLITNSITGSAFTSMLMTFAVGSCVTSGILHVTRAKPNDFHVSM